MCAAVILFSAGEAYGQTESVIFPSREITTKKAFDEIARQTQYQLTVNWSVLNADRSTLLSGNVLSVSDLLRQVLSGTGYTWEVSGKQIFFKAEPARAPQRQGMLSAAAAADASRPATSAIADPNFNTSRLRMVRDPYAPDGGRTPDIRAGRRTGHWSSTGSDGESIEIVMVNFRVGKSLLERDFMNNAYSLGILDRTFSDHTLAADMDYVTITAASSPEGNTEQNEKLADDRAMAIKSYIMWKHPHLDRTRILTYSVGEDWSGLKKMVEDDVATPGRYEVLDLLNSSVATDVKKSRLRTIDNGRAYAYIAKNMLPYLRGGAACMIYYKSDNTSPEPEIVTVVSEPEIQYVDRVRVDTVFIDRERVVEIPAEASSAGKPYYLGLKTNLLYDAVLLPNLAVEFSLPRRWSIEVEGMWSWWNTNSGKHYYHRIQSGGLEVRKWLGRSDRTPLTGHYLGVYGMFGNYDVRFGDVGNLSEAGSWSAGISYGYAMPISRSFNLEFGIGIGYFGGDYKKYTYDSDNDRFPWQSDHTRSYFGPTKAKVSLIWLVGSGKNQKKKR